MTTTSSLPLPRRALVGLLALLLLPACLLVEDPLDFQEYELRGVPYDEALDIVETVTRRFYGERFSILGGYELELDRATGRLQASPVVAGPRRMTLYLVVEPRGEASVVSMLALVQSLVDDGLGAPEWSVPQMDQPLQDLLYEQYVGEIVRRRGG